jgi:hypothetical protein
LPDSNAIKSWTDLIKADGTGYQFGMRVFWLVLGTACAAIGWELLTILMR